MRHRLEALGMCLLLCLVAVPALLVLPLLCLFAPLKQAWACIGALDRFGNAALWAGSEFETISSAAWRFERRWLVRLCELLERDHCERAYYNEKPLIDFVNPYVNRKT